jgi:putative ABC transport system permease protein
MLQDLRYAIRTLRKKPLFTVVAVLALALGFGANTAIFSVIDAVVLHPLPFRDADRLVAIWEKNPALEGFIAERLPAALKNYNEWKKESRSFEAMGAFNDTSLNLTGFDKPEQVTGAMATPDFFAVLGIQPTLGRAFTAQEASGDQRVAILSAAFHKRRFGGSRGVLGQTLTLNGAVYTIAGVLPSSFQLPALWEGLDQKKPDVWLPLNVNVKEKEEGKKNNFVFARLRRGVTLDQARSEMSVIGKRLESQFAAINKGFSVNVSPLINEDVGPAMHRGAVILQFAVGFVLLIACANVANLLLTRAAAREKEVAVRMALGATRGDILRQVLIESMLLGGLGGAVGIFVGVWVISIIGKFAPDDAYHLHELHLNVGILTMTFGMVFLAALLFGLAPAWYSASQNVNETLAKGGRSGSGGVSRRLRSSLVVSEVALATLLLVGSALMIRSFAAMLSVDLGFQTGRVLTMHVQLPESKYSKREQVKLFCDQLLEKVSNVPGVQASGIATGLPMLDSISISGIEVEGRPERQGETPVTDVKHVSEGYFDAIRQRIVRGRGFTRQEAEKAEPTVVVVNETLAKQLWHGQEPLGSVVRLNAKQRLTVIGIAADTHQMGMDTPARPEADIPNRTIEAMALVVRTSSDPMLLSPSITEQVWSIDKDQPVSDIIALDERTAEGNAQRRFDAFLFGSFAGLAVLLAAVGLYGVLSYGVAQRTREMGIRMALGADRHDVARLVVGNGFLLVAIGLGIGLAGAFALTRLMSSLVFGITTMDPLSYVGAVVVLAPIALLASYIPARRAARIDPMVSLRVE